MKHHYTLKSTNKSSVKYGNCEICHKPVSEVFYQKEEKEYVKPNGDIGLTQESCNSMYGCKECLIKIRKG